MTLAVSKQLLPIYDKPMVYYPLSLLMLAGIREILLISTPKDLPGFQSLFGDGHHLGLHIQYAAQPRPEGIAQAFHIGDSFVGDQSVCLVLGDNILYGHGLTDLLQESAKITSGAQVFGYHVNDPRQYGVVEFDVDGRVIDLVEKPTHPKSSYAVPGIYFYGPEVIAMARDLKPSARGELEITDLNRLFLQAGNCRVKLLTRGYAWLDTGTTRSLADASNFIQAIEERQGLKVACLEEIAWRQGWMTAAELLKQAQTLGKSSYGAYLTNLANSLADFPAPRSPK